MRHNQLNPYMKKLYPFLLLLSAAAFAQVGTVDNSFNPADNGAYRQYIGGDFYDAETGSIVSGTSSVVRLPDGKYLINYYNMGSGVYRLNADGSVDTSFTLNTDPGSKIYLQPDGKIYVLGNSATILKRYNANGTIDNTFTPPAFEDLGGPATFDVIKDIAFQADGKIYIAGTFTEVNNAASKNLVRLNANGTVDTSFTVGTGFDWTVNVIKILPDGKLLAGGSFEMYNNVSSRFFIRLNSNGTKDTSLTFSGSSYFYDDVCGIEVLPSGKIMVFGGNEMYRHNNSFKKCIVRLNANYTLDTSFDSGNFFFFSSFPYVNNMLTQPDGKVIIGASKDSGMPYKLYRLNADGTEDTSFATNHKSFDGGTGSFILLPDGKIIIPDSYIGADGITRSGMHRLNTNGSIDLTFNPLTGSNGAILKSVVLNDNKILLAGRFTSYNDMPAKHIARLNADGTPDNSFSVDNSLTVLQPYAYENGSDIIIKQQADDKLLLATNIIYANNNQKYLVRLNYDGSLDTGFNSPAGDYPVKTMSIKADGKLLVSGNSSYYSVNGKYKIVRLNLDGTVDNTYPQYGFNEAPQYIEIQPDGKALIAGSFSNYNNVTALRLIRLNEDGTRDTSFNFNASNISSVYKTLTQEDGKVIISYKSNGNFKIARLNADGTIDNSFFVNMGGYSSSSTGFIDFARLEDGRIVFKNVVSATTENVVVFNGIDTINLSVMMLNADGTWNQAFTVNVPKYYDYDGSVNDIAVQGCDKLIFSGNFVKYNSAYKNHILRINLTNNPAMPAGNTTQTFTPGETLADLDVTGQNVQWYSMQSECSVLSTSRSEMDTDEPLPLNTPLQNGVTYYASQTISGLESSSRLGVTAMAAMGIAENTIDVVKVYPNPTAGMFTISGAAEITSVSVYTLYGQTLLTEQVNAHETRIDLSAYQTGMYLVKVTSGKGGEKTYKVNKL